MRDASILIIDEMEVKKKNLINSRYKFIDHCKSVVKVILY